MKTTAYYIEPDEEKKGKGRTFSAQLIAKVSSTAFLDTSNNVDRPCFAMFAGSLNELRPFIANLTLGRKATSSLNSRHTEKLEFLKSTKYQVIWQIESEPKTAKYAPEPMSVATIYYPEAFLLDPGMVDPQKIAFCALPTKEWVAKQVLDYEGPTNHMLANFPKVGSKFKDWVAHAYLFAALLDRRTRCPLPMDGRFYLQLFYACCKEGLLKVEQEYTYDVGSPYSYRAESFKTMHLDQVGLSRGFLFYSSHTQFEAVLSSEVTKFYDALANPGALPETPSYDKDLPGEKYFYDTFTKWERV